MIIIQPSGGLCNRMRVINSGWKLARERKEKLQILWNCNAELNCPFESLFQPVTEFKITSIHSVADPRKLFHQKTAKNYLTNETILAHRNSDGCLDPDYVASLTVKTYIFTRNGFIPPKTITSSFLPSGFRNGSTTSLPASVLPASACTSAAQTTSLPSAKAPRMPLSIP